jgi:hypothetical protein
MYNTRGEVDHLAQALIKARNCLHDRYGRNQNQQYGTFGAAAGGPSALGGEIVAALKKCSIRKGRYL